MPAPAGQQETEGQYDDEVEIGKAAPWQSSLFSSSDPVVINRTSDGSETSESSDSDGSYELDALNQAFAVQPVLPASELVSQLHLEYGGYLEDLNELEHQGLLSTIPRNRHGKLTSIGSVQHQETGCRPCIFAPFGSCVKSLACSFCHLRHKKCDRIRRPARPRGSTARRVKGLEAKKEAAGSPGDHGPAEPRVLLVATTSTAASAAEIQSG